MITDDPLTDLERGLVRAAALPRTAVPPRRRRRVALAAAAVAAAIAAAAILLPAGGGSSPSLVGAALAQLTPRHAILKLTISYRTYRHGQFVQRGSGVTWFGPSTARSRYVVLDPRTGAIRASGEVVRSPRSFGSYSTTSNTLTLMRTCPVDVSPDSDFAFLETDPLAVIRARLADGSLRPAGAATLDGRSVARLADRGARRVLLVDPRTGAPLAVYFRAGSVRTIERYTQRTRLPLTSATRGLLRLSAHPGARLLRGSGGCPLG